ncbi:preprotein translocase subunit SecE [Acidiferrobacter sp.]|uniref:preprotein translocase subunit SecE n=1 Tax=Acidiferrobacter sp. TaxID=1872107 RepID=UPI00261E4AAF|nr:preprotein translocase subunit SecE [Acidiferrobacter sp.]
MVDKLKLTAAMMLLAAGVVGYYILANEPELWRIVALLAGLALATAAVMQTPVGRSAWLFMKEARVELSKVVWPTRKETVQTTLVVIALVLLVALFLWIVDLGLIKGVSMLTGRS